MVRCVAGNANNEMRNEEEAPAVPCIPYRWSADQR